MTFRREQVPLFRFGSPFRGLQRTWRPKSMNVGRTQQLSSRSPHLCCRARRMSGGSERLRCRKRRMSARTLRRRCRKTCLCRGARRTSCRKWLRPRRNQQGVTLTGLSLRVSVLTLRVPPLRERAEDLPLLAAHALRQAREAGARAATISEEALATLNQYDWPGNVRELENTIAHAALYARGKVITPEDLPAKIRNHTRGVEPESKPQTMFKDLPSLDELERRYLIHVMQSVNGSRTRAAEVLGIDRRTLYRMAERFGINLKEGGE